MPPTQVLPAARHALLGSTTAILARVGVPHVRQALIWRTAAARQTRAAVSMVRQQQGRSALYTTGPSVEAALLDMSCRGQVACFVRQGRSQVRVLHVSSVQLGEPLQTMQRHVSPAMLGHSAPMKPWHAQLAMQASSVEHRLPHAVSVQQVDLCLIVEHHCVMHVQWVHL